MPNRAVADGLPEGKAVNAALNKPDLPTVAMVRSMVAEQAEANSGWRPVVIVSWWVIPRTG